MDDRQRERAAAIIVAQQALNRQSLAELQQLGLDADAVVQLDFFFDAPNRTRALELSSFLEQNDCLDVSVVKAPGLFAKACSVTGKSQPTTVDIEILDEWVEWMAVQGVLRDCEFDGWGVAVGQ